MHVWVGMACSRNRPSGAQCLRRLRQWQANGKWEAVLAELRLWAGETALLVAEIDRLATSAENRRPPHKRPSRSRRCSRSEHRTNESPARGSR